MIRYATLALCLLALPAGAALYKWTDENGKVHYSDQPPPNSVKKSETIKQQKPAASVPEAPAAPPGQEGKPTEASKTPADQEMEFRRRKVQESEEQAKAQREAQLAEEKKQECARATARVTALQTGARVSRYGPNGEQIYLSDAEIAQELIQARKVADSWCK